ncbi:hypothetical protein KZO01_27760 [Kurthia zopfii]|uniref:DNA replication protein n=1 Tax=Kurthia zopfii TaxID=1650 RepID=A0A2U3AAP8_9BACL|nr:hypothetical protein DF281_11145 [Kurthia zopfii]TDR35152.1 hypothetical protein DFR61_1322 [Kurthia zopfii]GEK32467.1 hypothetical protein KZO01_27760 [Kurthia zopfii]STX09506.1 DNA replication protein [Kurthia zopfii]VEI06598.1 DNA replication protein [Kurthia zopfii]
MLEEISYFLIRGISVLRRLRQGDVGVGKSHLAMSILRNLNEKRDVECLFISVREMMSKIRDSFDNKEIKFDLC